MNHILLGLGLTTLPKLVREGLLVVLWEEGLLRLNGLTCGNSAGGGNWL